MIKKNKYSCRGIYICCSLCSLVLFLCAMPVLGEQYFLVHISPAGESFYVSGLSVIGSESYSYLSGIEGDYQDFDGLTLKFSDESRKVIGDYQVHPGENMFDYISGANHLTLETSGSKLFSSSFSFCDADGVCEPCLDGFCTLSENHDSCSDCKSASYDGLCDSIVDGRCDPDCGVDISDKDCPGEYARGSAVGEYVETMVQLENDPSFTITPTGNSALDEEGVDYCLDDLGGYFCGPDERCAGEEKEYAYGAYCCLGDCVQYDRSVYFSDEKVREINQEAYPPVSEIARIYNFSEMEARKIVPSEESVQSNTSQVQEEVKTEQQETEESVLKSVDSVLNRLNFLYVAGIVLAVAVGLILLLSFANRGQKQKDLQQDIDLLISRGNDYKSVEQILIQKGLDKSFVDAEINSNYKRRVEFEKMRQSR